ncbi:hypothetical protein CBP36_19515 (plasmid) [Acidovorax carolinensis]|jgi:hypothetical protein|uniref:Uncharacterized protein n=1 Tax=Acidovorax carolinensis TaxID=553814 RepID=A0A240UI37_9BURK|nr:hypothetical protein [Acidovorax carolinensis]ART57095.1 hypothetical protein CBP35_19465 [Acidovorax carolinensis]ART61157.1 hypothetical protein CBP36_19515 [Acidovorax carolinensis]
MAFKNWNVRVHLKTGSVHLGQVGEENEALARCAALSKFGIPEDEDADPNRRGIRDDDEFDVTPA